MKRFVYLLSFSLFFLVGLVLINNNSSIKITSAEDNSVQYVLKANEESNEDDSSNNDLLIGLGLVGATGVGAGIAVYNNKNKKMNEPSKTIEPDPNGPTDKKEDFRINQ